MNSEHVKMAHLFLPMQKDYASFFIALVFVIYDQYLFCDALLWETKHQFSSKQMRDLQIHGKQNSNQNTVN